MPSIAETTRDARSRERWRLAAGVISVLAGALLVGLGTAGSIRGASAKTELIIGGAVVLLSLAVLGTRADLRDHERDLTAVGVAIGVASLLFVWGLTPASVVSSPVLTAVGGLWYLSSVTIVLAAILAGTSLALGDSRHQSGPNRVAWTRTAYEGGPPNQVADGGDEEDDLSFPLDDE